MSTLRKIASFTHGNRTATVRKDADLGEYVVQFTKDDKRQPRADYFTGCKQDAIGTARVQIGLPGQDVPVLTMTRAYANYVRYCTIAGLDPSQCESKKEFAIDFAVNAKTGHAHCNYTDEAIAEQNAEHAQG